MPLSAGIQKGMNCSPKVFNGILAQMPDKWNPYGKYSIGKFGTNGFTDDAFMWPLLASVYTIAPPLLLFVSGGIPETKSKKKKSLVYDRHRGNTSSEFIKNARNMLKILFGCANIIVSCAYGVRRKGRQNMSKEEYTMHWR